MKNNPTNITSEGASKKLVPELRFPEFVNEGEWTENVFGELFTYLPNNTLSRAELTDKRGDVQNIHYGDILIKFPNVLDAQKELLPSISDVEQIRNIETSRLRDGDVVIADTAEDEAVGKCTEIVNVGDSRIVSGLHTIPCRPNITFTKGYLGHYMNSNAFHYRLRPLMQGAKVTSISKTALKNVTLTFPHSIAEQQKIAQCLSSLDELIAATKEKVELLKEHKRGLMQKLFPVKGKTLPELRFPEFKNEGEWEEQMLGDCLSQTPDYGLNAPAIPYSLLKPTYLRITDIDDNGRFITEKKMSVETEITEKNSLTEGDIVFARTGASVGKVYKYRVEDGPLVFAGFLIRVRPNISKYSSEFIFQYLFTDIYKRWVQVTSARSGQPGINSNEYASLRIPFPNLAEQQKIAQCLSSLDELITETKEKVKALELHKKGLMQKLFPNK